MIFFKGLYLLRFFPSVPDQLQTFRIFIEDTLFADRLSVFLRTFTISCSNSVLADLAFSFVEKKRMSAKLGI